MSIKVSHISKSFGSQLAQNDVSFTTRKGEVEGFLGPNGAGKSTLMKILTTNHKADAGMAEVNGYDVLSHPRQVQRSVGYLPEHNPMYLELYIKEYLEFCRSVYGISRGRIQAVVDQTGLGPEIHKKIGPLS